MQDVTRLRVWQRAREVALKVEREAQRIDERLHPGHAARVRESVHSIEAHIAHGAAQPSPGGFARALNDAIGATLAVQREMARLHAGVPEPARIVLLDFEIRDLARMLIALRRRVQAREAEIRARPARVVQRRDKTTGALE
jgi:four helix bundle protein